MGSRRDARRRIETETRRHAASGLPDGLSRVFIGESGEEIGVLLKAIKAGKLELLRAILANPLAAGKRGAWRRRRNGKTEIELHAATLEQIKNERQSFSGLLLAALPIFRLAASPINGRA